MDLLVRGGGQRVGSVRPAVRDDLRSSLPPRGADPAGGDVKAVSVQQTVTLCRRPAIPFARTLITGRRLPDQDAPEIGDGDLGRSRACP
jgi:hypothetical protein